MLQENGPQGAGFLGTGVTPQASAAAAGADAALSGGSAIEAAIAGDPKALNRVWLDNRRWVAAIILAHKPRWADLDDLLQEVAMSLVRKVGEVRDPRALKPWLRTVAMNAAHAAARSGKRRAKDLTLEGDVEQPFAGRGQAEAAEVVGDREEGRRLLALAAQLPDGYREPLLLKAVQNLSYREIGESLELRDDRRDKDCAGAETVERAGDGEGEGLNSF